MFTISFDAPDVDAPDKVRVCMGMLDSQLSAKILAISSPPAKIFVIF